MSRWGRLLVLVLAAYLTLLGGSPYYNSVFVVRVGHHIIMTVVLVGWLIWRWRSGRGLPATGITLPLLGILGVYALTTLASRDPRVSLEMVWFPFTYILLFWVMAAIIQSGGSRTLIEAQLLMGAMVVLIALLQLGSWWFGWGIVPGTSVGWSKAAALGVAPSASPLLYLPLGVTTWLAAYTAPLAVFSAIKAATERQRDLRIGLIMLTVGLVVVNLLTGSRGGVIALGAAGAALGTFRLIGSSQFRRLTVTRQIGLVLIPLGLFAIIGIAVLFWTQARAADGSDALRLGLWRGAVTITADSPIVGVGPGMFGRVYREVRDPAVIDDRLGTAHNIFLNTAAETGLIGIAALAIVIIGVGQGWMRRWRAAEGTAKLRLEAAAAGVIGFALQSQFDLFTATPIVLLILFLSAYALVTANPSPDADARWSGLRRWAALAVAAIAVGYGVALLNWDRAHAALNASLRADERTNALAAVEQAMAIDPTLRLYPLWQSYLIGDAAAIQAALSLEPTWDTGWLMLAAVQEQAGDTVSALESLRRAALINGANTGDLHWARLADASSAVDDDAIIAAYVRALRWSRLPLSPFWTATDRRRQALDQYMAEQPIDVAYRVYRVHDPDRLPDMVSRAAAMNTAEASWVMGEAALMDGQTSAAVDAFSRAVAMQPGSGDYRASLGRALAATGQVSGALDALLLADLMTTQNEYPNAIRATLANDENDRRAFQLAALTPRIQMQNFEGVLYAGRVAGFDLPPTMRPIGPGADAMQPWYDLAASMVADGRNADAMTIYRAILDYAPEEVLAVQYLDALMDSRSSPTAGGQS